MFSFLKEKLKSAVSIFTKKVEEEVDEEIENNKEIEEDKKQAKKEIVSKKEESKEKESKTSKEDKKTKEKTDNSKKVQEKIDIKKEKNQKDLFSEKKKETKEILKKAEQEIEEKREEKKEKEITKEKKEEEDESISEEKDQDTKHLTELEESKDKEDITEEEIIKPAISEIKEQKKEEKSGFFGKIKGFFGKKEEKEEVQEYKKIENNKEKSEKAIEETSEEETRKESEEKELKQSSSDTKKEENQKKETQIKKEIKEKEQTSIKEEKKGFFGSLGEVFTKKTLSVEKFEEIFYELEIALLENNVALLVIEKIKEDMKNKLVNQKLKRNALDEEITASLEESIKEILSQESFDFIEKIKEKKDKPLVVCFFGINGSGKTTTIAKLAHYLKKNHISVVLAAADTFRAAAIDQLQKHGDNLGIKVIKQEYGADAAAVAFDAISYGKAHKMDIVLIDTAGRSHSNVNLMDELKKIIRVAKPDLNIFIGDSLTGNDMVEQAEKYKETVGIDGIILAKADVDEKGGATISASYVTKKPILFLGMGQTYDDLETFNKEKILEQLGLS